MNIRHRLKKLEERRKSQTKPVYAVVRVPAKISFDHWISCAGDMEKIKEQIKVREF